MLEILWSVGKEHGEARERTILKEIDWEEHRTSMANGRIQDTNLCCKQPRGGGGNAYNRTPT